MTAAEQADAKGGPLQVPVNLGAEGVVHNLSLPAGSRLHLTGPVIARIFLGQITSWRDPAITALNPGINLPDAPISGVHRTDGSGTTYIFSNYLPSASPAHGQGGHRQDTQVAGRGGSRRQRRCAPRPGSGQVPRRPPVRDGCRDQRVGFRGVVRHRRGFRAAVVPGPSSPATA